MQAAFVVNVVAARLQAFVAHGVVVFTTHPVTQVSRQADSFNYYAQVLAEHVVSATVNPHKLPAKF